MGLTTYSGLGSSFSTAGSGISILCPARLSFYLDVKTRRLLMADAYANFSFFKARRQPY